MESRSPTYNSWQAMKKRCLNKKHKGYKDYGEKGITICDEWIDSYQNFKRDLLASNNILSEGIRLYRTKHKTNVQLAV